MLLVDDHPFNLMPLEGMLEDKQIVTEQATSGQESVNKFNQDMDKTCCNRRYKLVMMDIYMPDMNGHEATKLILQILEDKAEKGDAAIIGISSFENQSEIDECY